MGELSPHSFHTHALFHDIPFVHSPRSPAEPWSSSSSPPLLATDESTRLCWGSASSSSPRADSWPFSASFASSFASSFPPPSCFSFSESFSSWDSLPVNSTVSWSFASLLSRPVNSTVSCALPSLVSLPVNSTVSWAFAAFSSPPVNSTDSWGLASFDEASCPVFFSPSWAASPFSSFFSLFTSALTPWGRGRIFPSSSALLSIIASFSSFFDAFTELPSDCSLVSPFPAAPPSLGTTLFTGTSPASLDLTAGFCAVSAAAPDPLLSLSRATRQSSREVRTLNSLLSVSSTCSLRTVSLVLASRRSLRSSPSWSSANFCAALCVSCTDSRSRR
eukprot:Hpha_TRINITY_DN16209_c1_g5::TRINITY_DN16209_c1_g5_i1::g.13898::m.13898